MLRICLNMIILYSVESKKLFGLSAECSVSYGLGPYLVIISFSFSYYNDYNVGRRIIPLDHY